MNRLYAGSALVALTLAGVSVGYGQSNNSAPGDASSVEVRGSLGEVRLPYINDRTVYPKSLNEQPVIVYRDPSDGRKRRYIKPYFMPSWEIFSQDVEKACTGEEPGVTKTIPLRVQFASRRVNEEIATELQSVDDGMHLSNLFSYPVFALFVVSGASDPADDIKTRIQFRHPPGISESLPRGVVAAVDFPLTNIGSNPPIRISETCGNLRELYSYRDINAFIYTQHAEVKLNASTALISAFVESDAFSDLERSESAEGVVRVQSRSGSSGIGFNLGGYLGGSTGSSSTTQTMSDTRRRAVSASVAQQVAETGAVLASVSSRLESAQVSNSEAIVQSLLDFILSESEKITARFEARERGQLAIVTDTYSRTLSQEEAKLLMESAPVAELNMTGKSQVDCSMLATAVGGAAGGAVAASSAPNSGEPATPDAGSQCGSERGLVGKYSDSIKWERSGENWIPTSVDLYVVNTQRLRRSASLSIETAIVEASNQAQIHTLLHVTDAEPTNYLLDQMDLRVSALVAKIDGPKKVIIPVQGGLYRTTSYWSGGRESAEHTCLGTPQSPGDQFELVGAVDIITTGSRGCAPGGHCDSTGEFCTSYERSSGCFVNKEWLSWYRDRVTRMGASPSNNEICASPL